MKFKQVKTGFMKKFEGCWIVEPLFGVYKICFPFKPKTWSEYCSRTKGKGRLGSADSTGNRSAPAHFLVSKRYYHQNHREADDDLLAEAARIRGDLGPENSKKEFELSGDILSEVDTVSDIKRRWALRRRNAKEYHRRLLTAN